MQIRRSLYLFAAFALLLLFSFSHFTLANDDADSDVDVDVSEEASPSSGDVDVDVDSDEDVSTSSIYGQQQYTLETLPSSGDLHTTVYFPASPKVNPLSKSHEFIVGEEVTVLLGVANSGSRAYNLTYISGSLHSPFDYSYYIQNFTVSLIGAVIEAGSEISVEYKFKTDANLEPLQFQLEAYFLVNTTDDREIYRTTFFNSTVELIERNSDFNTRTLFSYLLILSVLGGGGYLLYSSKYTKSVRRSQAGPKKPVAEWDAAPAYVPAKASKAVKKRSQKN